MRLWHKDLIPVLPRQQLIAQWRELCAIAGSIDKKGTPNHLLVNQVLDYPPMHFTMYANLVLAEMHKREYKVSEVAYTRFVEHVNNCIDLFNKHWWNTYVPTEVKDIYREWHNNRYLRQCYYNLQEKYDCGGISREDWQKIQEVFYEANKILQQ